MPPNKHRTNFTHPKLRGGRYWRRIRYTKKRCERQSLYRLLVSLSQVNLSLCHFHVQKSVMFESNVPCTNSNCNKPTHKKASYTDNSDNDKPAPDQLAEHMQYGGGNGNTLAAMWSKVRNKTTNAAQHEAAEIFGPRGEEWLRAHQISSCLTLLLHTKYRHAAHQPAVGLAHKVCDVKTLQSLLYEALQIPLPANNIELTKVLVDSCSTEGPCSSIVIGNDLHFRNICITAKTCMVDFVDPFGHGFPTEVIQKIQDFFDRHDDENKWTYKKWSHRLQTDCYNCGIWSIRIMETRMQYWSQGNITETFECFCKRHAAGLTGKGLWDSLL